MQERCPMAGLTLKNREIVRRGLWRADQGRLRSIRRLQTARIPRTKGARELSSNAVTRASRDIRDYDEATELEKLGGRVIELSGQDWRQIAGEAEAA